MIKIIKEEISTNELPDIYKILKQYGADDVEVYPKSEVDYYYKMCTTIDEVERFNYQDDYWGDAERYQEDNVWLFERIQNYIGKEVLIKDDYDDEVYTGTVLGIAIDKKYNSMSHTMVIVDEFKEV